jgi:catechol 2,3-dioxygenase-like lactoylglutathione lyase family enzyme
VPTSVFSGVNHICVVTADLDTAVRTWSDRFGVGPWSVYEYDDANMSATLDGKPADFKMRAALCQLGPHARLEIIEPLEGDSPYAQSLREHGGAAHIHHVRFDVSDYGASRAQLEDLGLPLTLDATFSGGDLADDRRLAGTYFDATGELGFIVEIAHRPDGFTMPAPAYVYP